MVNFFLHLNLIVIFFIDEFNIVSKIMERIPKSGQFNYSITRFVREDIIEIMDIFSDNCEKSDFVIEGYRLNSKEELKELSLKEAQNFKFKGCNPNISVDSSKNQSRLWLSDVNNTNQQGIKVKIDEIFNRNKSILANFESIFKSTIVMIIVGFVLGTLSQYNISISLVLGIIVFSFLYYTYHISTKKHTIVYLTKSKTDLNLWEKYGERAIVTLITTLVAGTILALINFFLTGKIN
jgi:hypothetical protein